MWFVLQSVLCLLICNHNMFVELMCQDVLSQISQTIYKMGIVLQVKLRPSITTWLIQGYASGDRLKI